MQRAPITKFKQSMSKLAAMAECMDNYRVGDPRKADWPNNILSTRTVVYESGVIARKGDRVSHAVDPTELALAKKLAREARALMKGVSVGMGSEAGDGFSEFFIAANVDGPKPKRIDAKLMRAAFGGTIFPLAGINVEPLKAAGDWWSRVLQDGEGSPKKYFAPWRSLIAWFQKQQSFVDMAFVQIGDSQDLSRLKERRYPKGTRMTGCVLPRLALGLTPQGSLVGLFGYVVQT
jgi:hypothetical protein